MRAHTKIGAVAVGVLTALTMTAGPAAAATGPAAPKILSPQSVQTFQDYATGFCLDSNASKSAYTNPCGSTNTYQHWTVVAFGSHRELQDVATGFCLDSNSSKSLYTNPCGHGTNSYQLWDVFTFGGNIELQDYATGFCLDSNSSKSAYTNSCGHGTNSYQLWH
ncbi:hypothetical protein GCM10009765_66920 [Fodinicola feengrottensis]|uniref:Ricin B lectin domain-containing protein n=1 Tax=Fodinicola feengrottensis TaxID=435914 RepID=A0ABN2IMI2_9ACTN